MLKTLISLNILLSSLAALCFVKGVAVKQAVGK